MPRSPGRPLAVVSIIAITAFIALLAGFFGLDLHAMEAALTLAQSREPEVRLSSAPVAVELPFVAVTRQRLGDALDRGRRLRLEISGLRLLHPGAVFQVYWNLPPGAPPDPKGPAFVGNLALFTEPGTTADITRSFDVTEQVRATRRASEGAKVTFVRERGPEPGEEAALVFLRLGRLALVAR